MYKKILALLIVGVVVFSATPVFAVQNYNSSKSNTSSVGEDTRKNLIPETGDLSLSIKKMIEKILSAIKTGAGDTPQPATGTVKWKNPPEKPGEIYIPDTVDSLPTPLPPGRVHKEPLPTQESTIGGEKHRPPVGPPATIFSTQKGVRKDIMISETGENLPEDIKKMIEEMLSSRKAG